MPSWSPAQNVGTHGRQSSPPIEQMKGRIMKINRKSQIDRVIAAQGLSAAEASEQVSGRIYEALEYIKQRAKRG